jgi:hypothetical protein
MVNESFNSERCVCATFPTAMYCIVR